MRRSAGALLSALCAGVLSLAGCTTTYTEADLAAEEKKMDADARFEEARDQKIADEGGANMEAIDEQVDWSLEDAES